MKMGSYLLLMFWVLQDFGDVIEVGNTVEFMD
jgi:hypothetical protein